ncbi:MAG: hypothetical protein JSR57_09955 [Verrucomicrobia bacterium]|nr:hypothetical protein [Verrucomicrobiota bacterium]
MASTIQPGLPASGEFYTPSAAAFQTFRATINQFLENKDYKGLDAYFHDSHIAYRPILEQNKTLDCILELLLEKPLNNDDCIRAFRLAGIMENKGYNPSWSKICQAMCYLQLGNDTDANFLVQQMIDTDKIAMEDGNRFIDLLNTYKRIYAATGNDVMSDRIINLLNRYDEVASQAPAITPMPFGETKI